MALGDIISTATGGLADVGFGIYDRYKQREKEKADKEAIKRAKGEAASNYDEMLAILDKFNQDRTELSTPEMRSQYAQMMAGYDPEAYTYDFDKFQFTDEEGNPLTREDFMAANRDEILQAVSDKIQHSAAGAGLGRGTGAALGIAEGVTAKDEELQRLANEQYATERNAQYNEWSDYINKMQAKLNAEQAGTEKKISMMGGAIASDEAAKSDYMADLLNLLENRNATITGANLALVG